MVWGTHILGNLHFLTIHYATPSGTPQKRSSSEGSSRHPMPRGIHIDIHIDAAFVFVLVLSMTMICIYLLIYVFIHVVYSNGQILRT